MLTALALVPFAVASHPTPPDPEGWENLKVHLAKTKRAHASVTVFDMETMGPGYIVQSFHHVFADFEAGRFRLHRGGLGLSITPEAARFVSSDRPAPDGWLLGTQLVANLLATGLEDCVATPTAPPRLSCDEYPLAQHWVEVQCPQLPGAVRVAYGYPDPQRTLPNLTNVQVGRYCASIHGLDLDKPFPEWAYSNATAPHSAPLPTSTFLSQEVMRLEKERIKATAEGLPVPLLELDPVLNLLKDRP